MRGLSSQCFTVDTRQMALKRATVFSESSPACPAAGASAAFGSVFLFNAATVGIGEAIACYGLGMLLLWRLSKSTALQNYLKNR